MKVQAVLDLARIPLNDPDKDRIKDTEHLLVWCNHALLTAFRRRPDLFIGSYDNLPTGSNFGLNSTFPLPDEYAQVIADYLTARGESPDDEHIDSGRAGLFFQLFSKDMNG